MNRLLRSLCIAGLPCLAAVGLAGPLPPEPVKIAKIPPLASNTYTLNFKGGVPAYATAVASAGTTFLGLYVYDAYGNCIALDDWGTPETGAAVAVDWLPREQANYMLEIRNGGIMTSECKIAVH